MLLEPTLITATTGKKAPTPGQPQGRRAAFRSSAVLHTAMAVRADGSRYTTLTTIHSESPLILRPVMTPGAPSWMTPAPGAAWVRLAAGAAGPVGGDQLSLNISVGPGSTLTLGDISATLLLPGPHAEESVTSTRVQVAAGATFVWLPKPLIAARGCQHINDVRIELERGARLIVREELLLGRHAEPPGRISQRLSVRIDGKPLYQQHLNLGPGTQGWDSPAMVGAARAIGSVLMVCPDWADNAPPPLSFDGDAAILGLNGPAVLISALGHDSLELRRLLDKGLAAMASSWTGPETQNPPERGQETKVEC